MFLYIAEIKNFRSLEQVKLDKLGAFNVLIGRNNAGKSSVFDTLHVLMKALSNQGASSAFLTDYDASKQLEIHLTFKPSDQERDACISSLGLNPDRRTSLLQSPFLRQIQFVFKSVLSNPALIHLRQTKVFAEDGQWAIIQRLAGDENTGNPNHRYIHISQAVASTSVSLMAPILSSEQPGRFTDVNIFHNQLFNHIWNDSMTTWLYTSLRDYLTKSFFFSPFRHSTDRLTVEGTTTLDPDGANLARVLHTFKTSQEETFEEIETFIHGALPNLGNLRAPLTGNQTSIAFGPSKQLSIPLTDMGGGIEQLLMIATALSTPEARQSPLFLEEPETHLHAGAQRYLIEKLYSPERQVFLTTHSPTFINLSKPFSLYQIMLNNRRTTIQKCQTSALGAVLDDIGVRNSDLLFSDAVLFVEGPGDKEVITTFGETLNMSFAESNIDVLPMGGARDVQRGAPIRSELLGAISAKAPVPHMFLIDRDERTEEVRGKLEKLLPDKVHIFAARELENYLLIPRAIISALRSKHRQDAVFLDNLANITEELVSQHIQSAADELYGTVLMKRIRVCIGGLYGGLLPETSLDTLLPYVKEQDLPERVLREITSRIEQQMTERDIKVIVKNKMAALEEVWTDPRKHLVLAPGEEILAKVFTSLGSTYDKERDTPRIAKEMRVDEISQEIINLLTKVRSLTSQ